MLNNIIFVFCFQILFCPSCQLQELFEDFYCGLNEYPVSIHKFLSSIYNKKEYKLLAGYAMHDCHEFFILFMNLIHQSSTANVNNNQRICGCIIHQTFHSMIDSRITCTNAKCNYSSVTCEVQLDLNLSIGTKINHSSKMKEWKMFSTIDECLQNYFQNEFLHDYVCNQCKFQKCCFRSLRFSTFPKCLCIHLKRFESMDYFNNGNGVNSGKSISLSISPFYGASSSVSVMDNILKKNECKIVFPVSEELDLSKYCLSDDGNGGKYRLRSIIVHKGSILSGHYMCFIRKCDASDDTSNHWFACDDHRVYPVQTSIVKQAQAYMLFYDKL